LLAVPSTMVEDNGDPHPNLLQVAHPGGGPGLGPALCNTPTKGAQPTNRRGKFKPKGPKQIRLNQITSCPDYRDPDPASLTFTSRFAIPNTSGAFARSLGWPSQRGDSIQQWSLAEGSRNAWMSTSGRSNWAYSRAGSKWTNEETENCFGWVSVGGDGGNVHWPLKRRVGDGETTCRCGIRSTGLTATVLSTECWATGIQQVKIC
jgi:hypothetical protein